VDITIIAIFLPQSIFLIAQSKAIYCQFSVKTGQNFKILLNLRMLLNNRNLVWNFNSHFFIFLTATAMNSASVLSLSRTASRISHISVIWCRSFAASKRKGVEFYVPKQVQGQMNQTGINVISPVFLDRKICWSSCVSCANVMRFENAMDLRSIPLRLSEKGRHRLYTQDASIA
jgi:hypothetical protein